jgi:hypothetical protein
MPRATFNSADLPADFFEFDHATQCQIIRIGVDAYKSLQTSVRELVVTELSEDDSVKAAAIRAEGIKSALESVQDRLAAVDMLEIELQRARLTVEQLRSASAAEAAKRAEALVEAARKDFDIQKLQAVAELREQLASYSSQTAMVSLLKEAHAELQEKVAVLEATNAELTAQKTKSSSAIGKAGEATVLEMLTSIIVPTFPFATVKDMTTVGHAADFHLWVMKASGKRAKILIDSKKYKRSISTAEIEKLYGDVDADTEAHAGLLISLESPISTMAQFQIGRTPKQRPVLFLTFHGVGDALRNDLLVWATRVLVAASDEAAGDEKSELLENLDEFLSDMDGSVKDIDVSIRGFTKSVDALKEVRDGIVRRILKFRVGATEETTETCTFVGKGGLGCTLPAIGEGRCGKHTKRRKADTIKLTE